MHGTSFTRQQLLQYFRLRLRTLLPTTSQDLLTALNTTQVPNLTLLGDLYGSDIVTVAEYFSQQLRYDSNGLTTRRAQFWLERFNQNWVLRHWILQHPQAGEPLIPRDLAESYYRMRDDEFLDAVAEEASTRPYVQKNAKHFLVPLFDTFKALYHESDQPWWNEHLLPLTRADIDEMVGYLGHALGQGYDAMPGA